MKKVKNNINFVVIPNYINVYYFKSKNILILQSVNKTCTVDTYGFCLIFLRNKLFISKLKLFDTTFNIKIRFYILEIESKISLKIKLFGLGYKIFEIPSFNSKILLFKLGFSHLIYYKIADNIQISVVKSLQLYINSYSFYTAMFYLAIIKHFKKPDSYKGKGFVGVNENLKLKPGKRV